MAKQTLQQLLGPKATRSGVKVTFDLTDYAGVGLTNATTASPTQAVSALLKYMVANLAKFADDPDAGIAAATYQQERSFVTRGNVRQIENPIGLSVYIADTTREFDPDAVI